MHAGMTGPDGPPGASTYPDDEWRVPDLRTFWWNVKENGGLCTILLKGYFDEFIWRLEGGAGGILPCGSTLR